ncbi:phage holin family protein [Massilia sp. AB1]|uniref:phage holin family protein n=1 Tax=Massilia sp. AB1 TaxID=2823371 RepID=UPI001B82F599|nr:phage holin family protein [Massilia sp. AB1]MBQ5941952.1 phage holin family protein [Massilia sp. AB1]
MSISTAVGRIGSTVLAMARTRLELATVELQEETQRLFGYLAWALAAAVLALGALVLAVLFVLVLFWDTHRLLAVGGMTVLFALGCGFAVMKLRTGLASRPPLLGATLAELRKDVEFAKGEQVDGH